jgi:SAM-dependent methyltransferase
MTSSDEIKALYDKHYASFAGHPGQRSEARYAETLLALLERRRLVPSRELETYADLGSGLGFKTAAAARGFRSAVGFELSETAVAIARLLNDSPSLEFRVADVLTEQPHERFDFVTAFGLSILNTPSIALFAARSVDLADRFLADRGRFALIMQTDYSGTEREGWFNFSRADVRRLREEIQARGSYSVRVYVPQRDPRAYVSFGREHALREFGKRLLRRPSDVCFIVSRSSDERRG